MRTLVWLYIITLHAFPDQETLEESQRAQQTNHCDNNNTQMIIMITPHHRNLDRKQHLESLLTVVSSSPAAVSGY